MAKGSHATFHVPTPGLNFWTPAIITTLVIFLNCFSHHLLFLIEWLNYEIYVVLFPTDF